MTTINTFDLIAQDNAAITTQLADTFAVETDFYNPAPFTQNLQAVRKFFETPLLNAYSTLTPPLPLYVDNQLYESFDSASEFGLLRLSFGLTTEPTTVTSLAWIRGSLVLEIYTPKGIGPGRGQSLIMVGQSALLSFDPGVTLFGVRGKLGTITGPSFIALDGQPHYLTRISAAFQARVVA